MQNLLSTYAYRLALSLALLGLLFLVWLSLGVGIIGRDGDPANALYFTVVVVGIGGAVIGRFKPLGLAYTSVAMAGVQALIMMIAVVAGLGRPWSGAVELLALNGFFILLFVVSAWLFRRAHGDTSASQ